ncbi:ATP-binding protein [Streptomyces sp. NBC_00102]|uniref:ATP-binding protein n=1 Tax=Streptomyces sp. NBC_00102 TaxID=2975652 RepID=UPI00225082E2|nr:ATP-binding protein [Streptomyces sp. NBC_00102]MCX5400669.1 ATP-binding protein [Streptomyces sp. NBC_00102]
MNEAITSPVEMVETGAPVREFAMRFTSTPRGARLSRRLVSLRLHEWGHPWGSETNDTLSLIAAELTANAVRHGRVAGRDFHVRLTEGEDGTLRIEVTDTRTERCPSPGDPREPGLDEESGRGLLLVSRLAERWGVVPRSGAPGKTVWAEVYGEKGPPGTA